MHLLPSAPALEKSLMPINYAVTASWYGRPYHGRLTASGTRYNMYAISAASPHLPFGTVLHLSRNNRAITVVVTDRGPYVDGRDLDLSYGAALALDMVRQGVARLSVTQYIPIPQHRRQRVRIVRSTQAIGVRSSR